MSESLKFIAEVKQVSSRKTASLDIVYKVVLETQDPSILSLGTLDADSLVQCDVEKA